MKKSELTLDVQDLRGRGPLIAEVVLAGEDGLMLAEGNLGNVSSLPLESLHR